MSNEFTLRRKLLALVLMPVVVISGLLGYFGYRDFLFEHQNLLEHGTSQVGHFADLAEFGLITGNTVQLLAAAESMRAQGAMAVRVYDADGRLLTALGEARFQPIPRWPAKAGPCGESGETQVFCAPVRIKPLPVEQFAEFSNFPEELPHVGHVELALSSKELQTRTGAVIQGYTAVLFIVLGMGLLLALRVERQLARPIAGLRDAVERIGRGELSIQVAETASAELLTLQRGFNAMSRTLAGNYADQERRIAEATAMLRRTLQELEQRNEELNREKHRAEAGSRAKSRFLAVMSHEIRTPLAGMVGMLSLLEKSGLNHEQSGYVRDVGRAADTLRQLIDEILDYSRLEVGKLAVFADPIRLSRVIDEVATMLAPSAAEKGLEFVVYTAPDLPDAVIGDALRLRQVLINLAANAIKFTERGRVRIEAQRVGGTPERPRVRFVVEDTGIGIPADQHDQVFESFAQVDSGPTRRYGGSGLGAAISRELVHLMDGDIDFTSELGVGSRFWFELPLAVDAGALPGEQPLRGRRVAVIEGDGHSRDALIAALAGLGADVIDLSEGMDAPDLDYLFLSDTASDDSNIAAIAAQFRRRNPYGLLCHVTPVSGAASAHGNYDCQLSKPVTRARLLAMLDERAKREAPGPQLARELAPLRILVAEDDDINARVIEMLLRRLGHSVIRARDGQQALEYLLQDRFDVAVLDIRMPEVDGPTVATRWRLHERESGRYLPMIALTANGSPEDVAVCQQAGIDEFLVKPITEKVLAEALEKLVA